MNDPEQAELIAAQERDDTEPKPDWAPRIREFDLHAMLLKEIRESLVGKRFPTPVTAVDQARRELSKKYQLELIETFTPHAVRRS